VNVSAWKEIAFPSTMPWRVARTGRWSIECHWRCWSRDFQLLGRFPPPDDKISQYLVMIWTKICGLLF